MADTIYILTAELDADGGKNIIGAYTTLDKVYEELDKQTESFSGEDNIYIDIAECCGKFMGAAFNDTIVTVFENDEICFDVEMIGLQ